MRALTLSLAAALLFSTSALAVEPAWLDQADTNDDGFVTPAEAQAYRGTPDQSAAYIVVAPRTTVATYTYYAPSPPVAYVAPAPSRMATFTYVPYSYSYGLSPPVAYVVTAPSTAIVAPAPKVTFVAPQRYVHSYVLTD